MQMKTVQETLREMDKKELMRKFFYEHLTNWIVLMMI